MKKTISILFLIAVPGISFCQAHDNYTKLGTVEKYPMKKADVLKYNRTGYGCVASIASVELNSDNDSVLSMSDGKVTAVFYIGEDDNVIVIKANSGLFFVYFNLKEIFVTKGDEIKTGALLGTAKFDDEIKEYSLLMTITGGAGEYYSEDKIWQLIKAQNAQVCDATKLNSSTNAKYKKINIKTQVQ